MNEKEWRAMNDAVAALLREQQGEIERLTKDSHNSLHAMAARWTATIVERDSLRRELEEAKDYIEALDVQNHCLRRDAETDRLNAERYLWLRGDLCGDHSHRWTQWEVRCWKAPMWTDDLRREDLDAAIDAARQFND